MVKFVYIFGPLFLFGPLNAVYEPSSQKIPNDSSFLSHCRCSFHCSITFVSLIERLVTINLYYLLSFTLQVFFSQWFQPHETIHLSKVSSDVEMIALDTLNTLKTSSPDHPIFKHQVLGKYKGGQNQENRIQWGSEYQTNPALRLNGLFTINSI